MKFSLREIMFAAAVGAFAMGVHAQATPDTQPKMNPNVISGTESKATGAEAKAQADANYKAAREACQSKTGSERASCLKDARAAHDRAAGHATKDMSGSTTGNAPSGTAAGGSQK